MELYINKKLSDITYMSELTPLSASKLCSLEIALRFQGLNPGDSPNLSGNRILMHLTKRENCIATRRTR